MNFMVMNINDFLVRQLSLSKESAIKSIVEKKVFINGNPARQRQTIGQDDSIIYENKEIQSPKPFKYIVYYKPKGIECTLNPEIENNLITILPQGEKLFPVGRLDKQSEGLLLLTNDGRLYKQIAGSEKHEEKEYRVAVDKPLTSLVLEKMSAGIVIMGQKTRLAKVVKIDDYSFNIVLTQGLNRQIRRMLYKLKYEVTSLKRTRIKELYLGDMQPGDFRNIKREEIF